MRPHSSIQPTKVYINLNSKGDGHHSIISTKVSIPECEIGDLNPNPEFVKPKLQRGLIQIRKSLNRELLSSGRP